MSDRVVVAMSGGVDSSVAAALLLDQGYEVVGVMLRLWSEEAEGTRYNRCCSPADTELARRVADALHIPFYLLDVAESFKEHVVDPFIQSYLAGRTPNPCLNCNRRIRFGWLLERALGLGASYLATGHYARIGSRDAERGVGSRKELLRGVDRGKDQSYVLSLLTPAQLSRILLPLGELTKSEVRRIAEQKGLPVAHKLDSQDLCFVADGDYRRFLLRHAPPGAIQPGPIRDSLGQVIGQHAGLPFYTIGQRHGLGLSVPQRLYVMDILPGENALVVGTADELGRDECLVGEVNYPGGVVPAGPFRASVKIRYQADEVEATVTPAGEAEARVAFDRPLRGIAAGQAAVFYDGERVVGGGIIR
ncbi:MAG: tRNA 2-thiouridine(34) synthase MnmA [Thermoflexales bacterium]|nr:tRNA 2-thiouridine(34) synthase MnmA [Thermoflexales bacterium]